MELTPTFNAAAQGDGGQMPTDAGPQLTGPGGGAAEAALETDQTATTEASPAFNQVTQPDLEPAQRHSDAGTFLKAPQSRDPDSQERTLKMLEDGRATPSLKHNFKPPPKIEQTVHTQIEYLREKLIAEIRAELDATYDLEADFDHEETEDLEPSL